MALRRQLFTIGHSTHQAERFLALLKMHGVTALCDVRSVPHSRMNPQFNRDELSQYLRGAGIAYVFLGKELGGRSDDASCYENGRIAYDRLAQREIFRKGLERIRDGAGKYRIALMCAEKDPPECHRTILVARHLEALEFDVQHILADGRLENHVDTMNRLVVQFNLTEPHIFRSHQDVIAEAYRLQERRIAYVRNDNEDSQSSAIRSARA
jgi:uncharacterized protein (DUF488 family)